MGITIKGARVNNLKNIDLEIGEGHTVVTGISGSGKSSLVFDTIYYEARRRLFNIFRIKNSEVFLPPANVDVINGLKPAIAVMQNIKNRNPNSSLASATGIHALLRILFANYGSQHCHKCHTPLYLRSEDHIVDLLTSFSKDENFGIYIRLVNKVTGSHRTLLKHLFSDFEEYDILINGQKDKSVALDICHPHIIEIKLNTNSNPITLPEARKIISQAKSFGVSFLVVRKAQEQTALLFKPICPECNTAFHELKPLHFNKICPYCGGNRCCNCNETGMYPEAAGTTWHELSFQQILSYQLKDFHSLLKDENDLPISAFHLKQELLNRSEALLKLGLGYLALDRSSPSLSRGEYQRVQLAMAIANRVDDVIYLLDEPTIGLHPYEVKNILPEFRKLKGTVIYIEHDKRAILNADACIEIGPGAGTDGGQVVFKGKPEQMINRDLATGEILEPDIQLKSATDAPLHFVLITGASARNLKNFEFAILHGHITVITGVSGSGKSTLVEEVIVPSLQEQKPENCLGIDNASLQPVFVNQDPIGINSRSNPATYVNLFDDIRNLYSEKTGLPSSCFTFNRSEGACENCNGLGEIEIKMRYLPSSWIKCPVCLGERYAEEVLSVKIEIGEARLSIADFLNLSVSEVWEMLQKNWLSAANPKILRQINNKIKALNDVGLGYLKLGQPSPTLSGGEAQRIKLAKYLGKDILAGTIMILDEPTTGLHAKDIRNILSIFDKLKSKGTTILVIEHNTDVIRYADWIIELGPGAGPEGGELIFAGTVENMRKATSSKTALALADEHFEKTEHVSNKKENNTIEIKNAWANNLKHISVTIPKSKITVVTGVSGSGKSSLVWDVIETEAKRRFLESLSVYERYSIQEIKGSQVESIEGLGLVGSIAPEKWLYNKRSTVGTITHVYYYLASLFSQLGKKRCPACKTEMQNQTTHWTCDNCATEMAYPKPESFFKTSYSGACTSCQGVGTIQKLNPGKIITHPEKPLLNGAMHSPGFFPKGFLGKPGNSGFYFVKTFAKRYHFNPESTPWNEMTGESQHKFLFGDEEPMTVNFSNNKGKEYTQDLPFPGFAGWIKDWDLGGTYTDHITCTGCNGSGLKKEYAEVTLFGFNIYELSQMPIEDLAEILKGIPELLNGSYILRNIWNMLEQKISFLIQTGLSYVHLNRFSSSLSAGEAQRIKLTTLLGNEMNNILLLLDEPTRGLHHQEVVNLINILKSICKLNNTLIVVEHDTGFMQEADYLLELGPGAGIKGGEVIAEGNLNDILRKQTLTSKWILNPYPNVKRPRRKPEKWVTVKGAMEHNLKISSVKIPLHTLTGICGVSGSGKSTLIIDTVARALIPAKQTTSVAYEPIMPGKHDSITGAPKKVVLVDQSKADIVDIASYLGIDSLLQAIYLDSEESIAQGYGRNIYTKSCSECGGKGITKINMEFLSASYVACESCQGTGYAPEAWEVKIKGLSLPELFLKNVEEIYQLWKEEDRIKAILENVSEVGLGYLEFQQPPHSLSSGEAQRLKLAMALNRKTVSDTLYILDEPTVGLHNEDVQHLITTLQKLVDRGSTVWVVEHHLNVLASCDYLVELGPGGGPKGGKIVAEGTPEKVALLETPTANSLKKILE